MCGIAGAVGLPDAHDRVALSRDVESIEESIQIILKTPKGERVMRPDFGAGLKRLAFAPNNPSTAGLAILLDEETRVLVQGITGKEGAFHTLRNKSYGTNVVAGVTPGKGGQDVEGIPVFDSVQEAVDETGADASLTFVPARFAADAILEAAESVPLIGAGDGAGVGNGGGGPPTTGSRPRAPHAPRSWPTQPTR